MAVSLLSGGDGLTQLQLIAQMPPSRNNAPPPADALPGSLITVAPSLTLTPSFTAATSGSTQPPDGAAATQAGGSGAAAATGPSSTNSVSQPFSVLGSYLLGLEPDTISGSTDAATGAGAAPVASNAANVMAASRYAAASQSPLNIVSGSMIC
jgi:hypothetical protein